MLGGMMLSSDLPSALHAGIVTSRFVETCEFYGAHFGFSPIEITAECALLGRSDGSCLAVLQAGGEGQPAALAVPTRGSGVWLSFEADDVDALHLRLVASGVEIVADPEYTLSGRRRCVARDPNGLLIYVTGRRGVAPVSLSSTPSENIDHEVHLHRVHRLPCH